MPRALTHAVVGAVLTPLAPARRLAAQRARAFFSPRGWAILANVIA